MRSAASYNGYKAPPKQRRVNNSVSEHWSRSVNLSGGDALVSARLQLRLRLRLQLRLRLWLRLQLLLSRVVLYPVSSSSSSHPCPPAPPSIVRRRLLLHHRPSSHRLSSADERCLRLLLQCWSLDRRHLSLWWLCRFPSARASPNGPLHLLAPVVG